MSRATERLCPNKAIICRLNNTMRFRFSNTFGSQPVTLSAVTVGLQEYSGNVVDGTMARVTFGGRRAVTIPGIGAIG